MQLFLEDQVRKGLKFNSLYACYDIIHEVIANSVRADRLLMSPVVIQEYWMAMMSLAERCDFAYHTLVRFRDFLVLLRSVKPRASRLYGLIVYDQFEAQSRWSRSTTQVV